MESNVKERLICFIRSKNISKNKFEIDCGLSKRYVSNIRVSIQPYVIEKISLIFPELNVGWLLTSKDAFQRHSAMGKKRLRIYI